MFILQTLVVKKSLLKYLWRRVESLHPSIVLRNVIESLACICLNIVLIAERYWEVLYKLEYIWNTLEQMVVPHTPFAMVLTPTKNRCSMLRKDQLPYRQSRIYWPMYCIITILLPWVRSCLLGSIFLIKSTRLLNNIIIISKAMRETTNITMIIVISFITHKFNDR